MLRRLERDEEGNQRRKHGGQDKEEDLDSDTDIHSKRTFGTY
jgi:hypothetical protein